MEPGDDSEEAGSGATGGPVEVRVPVSVGPDQLTGWGDHVDGFHALAGRAVDPAVPAEAALEQIATDRHPDAVADREEEVVLFEFGVEQVSPASGCALARIACGSIWTSSSPDRSSRMPPSRRWLAIRN